MRRAFGLPAIVLAFIGASSAPAKASVIDFDSFADSAVLTNQVAGVTFANATVLTAGIGLNEFEFPPRSGNNAAFDDGGPMSISFASPLAAFSGYFTYTMPVTLSAYNGSNQLLGSATSAFTSNLALSGSAGSSPNELLQLAFAGIALVVITGDPLGGSFVLDDATLTPMQSGPTVPEPSTLALMASGSAALLRSRVLRRRRRG